MILVGVVILYYPDESIIKNIYSYVNELNSLYVIDNTEHPIENVIDSIRAIPKVQYVSFGENKGISYALNYVLKQCNDSEEEIYLLTMDQDSSFQEGMLKKYKDRILHMHNDNIAAYTLQYTSIRGVLPAVTDSQAVRWTLTSGMIIRTKIAQAIGGFNESLFIDAVDYEFCYRIYAYHYKVWLFHGIILNHKIGEPTLCKFLWRTVSVSNHSPIRRYYIARNNIYLLKKYKESLRPLIDDCIKGIIKAMLFESDKKKKLSATMLGMWDGITGNMGKCKRTF